MIDDAPTKKKDRKMKTKMNDILLKRRIEKRAYA